MRRSRARCRAQAPASEISASVLPAHISLADYNGKASSELEQPALLRQAAEGDRPSRHLHGSNAVLPFMPRLPRQMIDRPRRQEHRRPIETAALASPKPHRRRSSERDAEDMLEHRPVSVPADSGTRVVADQQSLDKLAW